MILLFTTLLARAQFRSFVPQGNVKRVVITSTQIIYPPKGAKRAFVRLWGAGGGYASRLVPNVSSSSCTDWTNPALVAAGGGGGGGGSTGASAGGAGGAGGFARGADGGASCALGASTGCPSPGGGGTATAGGTLGTSNGSCALSTMPSYAGTLQTDASTDDGGGSAGTCWNSTYGYGGLTGSNASPADAAGAHYPNFQPTSPYNGSQQACTSGGGGGGRSGGGAGGVQENNTSGGCAGGGGGMSFVRTTAIGNLRYSLTRSTGDGVGSSPGYAGDVDLKVNGVPMATGGAVTSGNNVNGGDGTAGLMVIYFY